jgi:hypothetical protein
MFPENLLAAALTARLHGIDAARMAEALDRAACAGVPL